MSVHYIVCPRCKLFQRWQEMSSVRQLCGTCGVVLQKPQVKPAALLSEQGERSIRDLFDRYDISDALGRRHTELDQMVDELLSIVGSEIHGAIRQTESWFYQKIGRPCKQ